MVDSNNSRRSAFVCSLLALATLAIFLPATGYDFVQYDDAEYILNNSTVQKGLTWWGLVWSFVDVHVFNWHPVTWLSHMLDCQLFGLHAGGHHLVSVLLHCANVVLLFLLLRSMTGAFWRSIFAAALFAWHPLRVESVAWISERKDVLSGFFFLLTLLAYVRYVRQRNESVKISVENFPSAFRFCSYRWSFILFTLGLLSKSMLVTLPFVLLLIDFWPLNRCTQPFGLNRNLLIEKIPFFFLSTAVSAVTFLAQKRIVVAVQSDGPPDRLWNVLVSYTRYLEKFIWPQDLTVLYLRPQSLSFESKIVAALVLLGISAFVIVKIRQRSYLAVGWFWFLGMLIPVIGFVQVGLQSIADRYTYLPSIGLALMLAWGGHDVAALLMAPRKKRFVLGALGPTILLACAVVSRHQLEYWANTKTLMEHALKINPNNYVAHINLGVYFSRQYQTEEAEAHYRLARELDPAMNPSAKIPMHKK